MPTSIGEPIVYEHEFIPISQELIKHLNVYFEHLKNANQHPNPVPENKGFFATLLLLERITHHYSYEYKFTNEDLSMLVFSYVDIMIRKLKEIVILSNFSEDEKQHCLDTMQEYFNQSNIFRINSVR